MLRKMAWMSLSAVLATVPAQAQVELQGWAGYSFSDGVSGDTYEADDGNLYNRVDPKNSGSYGVSLGFFVSENVEVGFLWDRQDSTLVAKGTTTTEVAPLNIDNYHGFVAYNFGDAYDTVRPYVLGGIGATRYGGITVTGETRTLDVPSSSRFSTTWGLGVKLYPARSFGVFGGVRWTPTYIKTDATGWWCDPWWGGCWVVGNAQYANQFELHGGISLRF